MDEQQGRRVYVGNLPFSMRWFELKDFMRGAGGEVVHANISKHGNTSRGFGVVEFATEQDAQDAIEKLDGETIDGRAITVREDRSTKEPRENVVFFGNLPFSYAWQELKDLAREAGEVSRAEIVSFRGRSRGCGTVTYTNAEDAQEAIKIFNGRVVDDRELQVHEDLPRNERQQKAGSADAQASERPAKKYSSREFVPGAANVTQEAQFAWASGHGQPSKVLHVSNLPWGTVDSDLVALFGTVGPVQRAQVLKWPDNTQSGTGVIELKTEEDAALAIAQLAHYNYGGRSLAVTYARYSLT